MSRPTIAITMGDVAGIGPEVVACACADRRVLGLCRPIVVGHPQVLWRALQLQGLDLQVVPLRNDEGGTMNDEFRVDRSALCVHCWNPADDRAADVPAGTVDPRAGAAAYEYLVAATRTALEGKIDAVVTAPLNKAALQAAGHGYPGHTEILAEICGVERFAMMLYLPPDEAVEAPHGLGVAHATLHTSLARVPGLLTTEGIREKVGLLEGFLRAVGSGRPRIAVCALNPHAGEGGLFGDEESRIIAPAVESARQSGTDASGPLPADTLFRRAVDGEFDGIVAMYHDQGHIALKLLGGGRAVNVSLGLPIVRTSPSHGTAFDIAWQGKAEADGLIEAVRVAAVLAQRRRMR